MKAPPASVEECVKLTTRALLEVVQTGAKNIEITVVKPGAEIVRLDNAEIAAYVDEIEKEKQQQQQKQKRGQQQK